jgi:DMSO reductase family type II enzyme chaperone
MKEPENLARSQMYNLLSITLSYPNGLDYPKLVSEMFENSKHLPGYDLNARLSSLKKTLEKYEERSIHRAESEYLDLFESEHNSKCLPYELDYLKGPLFMKTEELADIAGFYRAFGLEVSDNNRVRVDHISAELEFMYFLALKEAHALKDGKAEEREICREAQRKFLTDHLCRWTEAFHNQVKRNGTSPFYDKLTLILNRFVTRDSEMLAAKAEKIKLDKVRPST